MDLHTFLYLLPIVLASLTLHELAHAFVAWRLGDPTAKQEGRLTLNPIVHMDPVGTLMFVVTGLAAGLPFGWAKPVPVNPGYFRRPKEGMAIVAIAGPLMNFLVALVCFAVIRHVDMSAQAFEVLRLAWIVNVVLGIFNLIPVPPLDGSRVLGVLMGDATYIRWVSFDQYGMLIVFGLFIVFRGQSSAVMADALIFVRDVMNVLVLA
jgi:Zn-dependent protease